MSIDRSPSMIRAAYFMAKHSESSKGKSPKPPTEMGADSWIDAYRKLFPQLGDGRSFKTFHGSINQDRRHYIDFLAGKKAESEDRRKILGDFTHRSRTEQWAEIRTSMTK